MKKFDFWKDTAINKHLSITKMCGNIEITYTPVPGELEHSHIELSKESAKILYDWLRCYLEA